MRRRVPTPLAALLAASFVLCLGWACLTPAFQAPDEQVHFAYVQSVAERFKLPGDIRASIYSTEHGAASFATRADFVAAIPIVKPEWSEAIYDDWARRDPTFARDNGGGATSASSNPPVAYLWQAAGYRIAESGDFFDRLFAARLASALWLPVTVLATWLLAGELFGRNRLLQLTAAAVPALLPMVAFITAAVNPDGMMYALWTLTLWLGVRCLQRGLSVRDAAAFAACAGLACVTKTTSYALLPGVALVLAVGLWRRRPLPVRRIAGTAAPVVVPLLLTLGVWYVVAAELDRPAAAQVSASPTLSSTADARGLASYLWHFYSPVGGAPGWPVFQVWLKQAWAGFGWLEVRFPDNLYRVLALLTGAVGIGAVAAAVRARRRIDPAVAAFLIVVTGSLLAGLSWTDYHLGSAGFMQGRYLFPLIGLFGCAAAAALTLLPERLRPPVAGVGIGVLFIVHLLSFGFVAARFYA
jgi:4-amino-4-deoxy-L-arabinose transferase-like glycosyltransferase